MFQNKGSTPLGTPPPGLGQPGRAGISTSSVHRAEQGRAARRGPPAAAGGPSQPAALLARPAPRAPRSPAPRSPRVPTYLPSRPATWTDLHSRRPWRPLGLGRAEITAHAHPAGWPGWTPDSPGPEMHRSPCCMSYESPAIWPGLQMTVGGFWAHMINTSEKPLNKQDVKQTDTVKPRHA